MQQIIKQIIDSLNLKINVVFNINKHSPTLSDNSTYFEIYHGYYQDRFKRPVILCEIIEQKLTICEYTAIPSTLNINYNHEHMITPRFNAEFDIADPQSITKFGNYLTTVFEKL